MADTGNGATLALSTTGAVGDIQELSGPEWTLDKIEDSHLGTTTFKTFIPGDLSEPGEITATVIFDQSVAVPANGVAETVTITWPKLTNSTSVTAASLAGTGFITGYSFPQIANNTLMVATVTVAFDGKTEPAFTAEA